jgi:hypothetical protein
MKCQIVPCGPFHGGESGSIPLGSANIFNSLALIPICGVNLPRGYPAESAAADWPLLISRGLRLCTRWQGRRLGAEHQDAARAPRLLVPLSPLVTGLGVAQQPRYHSNNGITAIGAGTATNLWVHVKDTYATNNRNFGISALNTGMATGARTGAGIVLNDVYAIGNAVDVSNSQSSVFSLGNNFWGSAGTVTNNTLN